MLVDNLIFQFYRIRVVSLSGSIPLLGIKTYNQVELGVIEARGKIFVSVLLGEIMRRGI